MKFFCGLTATVGCLAAFVANPASAEPGADRPNVVYIMADDLGIGDVKCFGGDLGQIETPNLDRLAREGMMFTDAHASASVCIPSRIAIMTGRYPWRFEGPRPDGPLGFLNPRIPPGRVTLAEMMRAAGYSTGYVGKWHLGTLMHTHDGKNQGPANVDFTRALIEGPAQHGFDFSFILPGSLDMFPYAFVRNGEFVGSVTARKGWSAFHRVGPAAEDFEDYKVLGTITDEAEAFIGNNAQAVRDGKPFFLYFALTAPHTPISPSPAFEGKARLGLYGDFVTETDHCIGRIMAAIDKHGLNENTIVIATSDHGAAPYAGNIRKATPGQMKNLEKLGHYANGIYRGYKFSAYEGGLRVPFVVRWPKLVKPGSNCDRLIGLIDVMRTLADICGQQLAADVAGDSVSFLPLLKDSAAEVERSPLVMQSTHSFVVRQGEWKLILDPGSGCSGVYGNTPTQQKAWSQALDEFGRAPDREELKQAPFVQLFNLKRDPREQNNLAAQSDEKVRELIAVLDRQIADGRSTPGPKLTNDVDRVDYFAGVPKPARRD